MLLIFINMADNQEKFQATLFEYKTINNKTAVQSNDLTAARLKLTTLQFKIYAYLLSQLNQDDEDFKVYYLKVADFQKDIDYKTKDFYTEIKAAVKGLIGTVVEIKSADGVIYQMSLLSRAKYVAGIVELRFDPDLKPFLLGLKERFTVLNINNSYQLKSRYGQRFYHFFCRFSSTGWWIVPVEDLKWRLGLDSKSYSSYNSFKTRVIESAQQDLASIGIHFSFEEIKTGRKVTSLKFKFPFMKNGVPVQLKREDLITSQTAIAHEPEYQMVDLGHTIEVGYTCYLHEETVYLLLFEELSRKQIKKIAVIEKPDEVKRVVLKICRSMHLNPPNSRTAYLWSIIKEHFEEIDNEVDYDEIGDFFEFEQKLYIISKWVECLKGLKVEISQDDFKDYFQDVTIVSYIDYVVMLQIKGEAHYKVIESKFLSILAPLLKEHFHEKVKLQYALMQGS